MKKFLLILVVFFLTIDISAQEKWGNDSLNCITNLSLYREYYKQKNYTDALEPWRWVFMNCPRSSGNIYKNGPTIIKAQMKLDKDNSQAYIDTLMQIYDNRIEFFGKEGFVLGLKGSDLLRYDKKRYLEAYEILKQSIDLQENKSSAGAISQYFKSATLMEKNSQLSKQDILELYAKLSDIVDYNLINNDKKSKYYTQTSLNIESLFTPYADCNTLIEIYSLKFPSSLEDIVFLKRVLNVLDKKECAEDDLFYKVSSKLYELEPSALSASKMGKMSISRKEFSKAIAYCNEAINLEQDNDIKAKYYLGLADAYRNSGSYSKARSAVYSALDLKDNWGEAYMNLGNIYIAGASKCGSEFEQKAVYWIAVDMFNKALSDTNVKVRASKSINTYSKYFPSTEVCFFNNIDKNSSYQIECWINKSTLVRTSD
jgi:tetratricopeptide (TPR) repeat protein